jgi:hypothetical protein
MGMLGALGVLLVFCTGPVLAQQPARDDVGSGIDMFWQSPAAPVARVPQPPTRAVIYDNGPFVTHPGGGSGGADASALQTALGMNTFGFTASDATVFRLADDFIVPSGENWRVESVVVYCYQTGSTTTSTFDFASLRIWQGLPGSGTVVFGDTTTNRMAASAWTNAYRVTDTTITNNQRPLMGIEITVGMTFSAGTYWIDYNTGGTLASGPFCTPITVLGQTSTGNAQQFDGAAWVAANDSGSLTPQGLPFQLLGPDIEAAGLAVDGGGNNVLDPGETATVAPSWLNPSPVQQSNVTGTLSNFTGPAGGTYTIDDATAAYGTIPAGATGSCTTDCYGVTVTGTPRPAQHWDTTVDETLNLGATHTWTLHVGGSFTDVSTASAFYRFIETLLHQGVTGGCTATDYCPSSSTTREQMAVFVLVAKEGAGYTPVACAPPNLFGDVPDTSPFCRFIEELANRQVVTGCGPNLYCPSAAVTREQMAIFALRTLDPALDPPACVAGSEMFTDVPSTSPFCRWVEELARRGVVSGCGPNLYCPSDPVTREQMGVFLSVTFGLALYGI